ncbi:MAG: hypothetical protein A2234_09635 [Elusimicrobia bacterium RIFOXYA2_FULL_58_8]|nr:MAG: hypothetical protein A2285_06920 [Elusimicrobia bacterium RIFOXYA12_FULL_57_11]OGS14053.1 MAG: hypothetical protein A2234_09635 [Elusimicrobia bacterium RIFOXYA2_FULL_58_8]
MPYYLKDFEWYALLLDLKPVLFLEYGASDYEIFRRFIPEIESKGLKVRFREHGRGRNLHSRNRNALWHNNVGGIFISRQDALIDRIIEAYLSRNIKLAGKLLGYPECCVSHMLENKTDKGDFLQISNNTMVAGMVSDKNLFVPEMNFLSHYDGRVRNVEIMKNPDFSKIFNTLFPFTLTDHLPCSMECEASRARGQRVTAEIKKNNSSWYKKAVELNGNPVLFLDDFHFFILKGGNSSFEEIVFSKIIFASETGSALYKALAQGDRVRRGGKVVSVFSGKKLIFKAAFAVLRPAILPFH